MTTETRKVIGVFEELVATNEKIGFPSVRVWIRGPNDLVTHDLKHVFPTRGTVFLHVSACENQHPQRYQVGLFNCVRSEPGESAEWMVKETSRRLARVIDCPSDVSEKPQLNFWSWLNDHEEKGSCSILLGDSTAYVRRGKRELVGPFSLTKEGKLSPHDTFVFDDVEVARINIAGHRYGFIDLASLPKGKPIVLDPREAILRRLKAVYRSRHFGWLSRDKVRDLGTALADVGSADGCEWVMADLPAAFALLSESGGVEARLVDALLHVEAVEKVVEAAWQVKHDDSIKKAKEEVGKLEVRLATLKSNITSSETQLASSSTQKASLEAVVTDLKNQIEAGKAEAKRAFEAELKHLAQSPASLALLGAWSSAGNRVDRAQILIKEQRRQGEQQQVSSLTEAFSSNLKSCGLLTSAASELATVCRAAIVAGQLILFRSALSELLAEAAAAALGQPVTLWADVPAGLLDPVDWDSLLRDIQKAYPIILQAANRSDISLVLGSMRVQLLRHALGFEKLSTVVFVTLESRAEMQVEADLPFGPILDDRMLRFGGTKRSARFYSSTELIPEVGPLSAEEFESDLGDKMLELPLFSTSSREIAYRRAYAALRTVIDEPQDAPRLFFKYWCLPRLSSTAVQGIVEVNKQDWGQDQSLMQLLEVTISDE